MSYLNCYENKMLSHIIHFLKRLKEVLKNGLMKNKPVNYPQTDLKIFFFIVVKYGCVCGSHRQREQSTLRQLCQSRPGKREKTNLCLPKKYYVAVRNYRI